MGRYHCTNCFSRIGPAGVKYDPTYQLKVITHINNHQFPEKNPVEKAHLACLGNLKITTLQHYHICFFDVLNIGTATQKK